MSIKFFFGVHFVIILLLLVSAFLPCFSRFRVCIEPSSYFNFLLTKLEQTHVFKPYYHDGSVTEPA